MRFCKFVCRMLSCLLTRHFRHVFPARAAVILPRSISNSSSLNMRLVQFQLQGSQKIGVELKNGGDIVNLTDADSKFPNNMVSFLQGGESLLNEAKRCAKEKSNIVSRNAIKILSPITKPEKVICVGLNYKDHCEEQNAPLPEEPLIFSKFPSSIIGDGDPIVIPKISNAVDWEVELAVVIGKRGKHIKAENALDHVAGYTIAHDVSARDWQMQRNGKQWLLGKTFDTFCPLGPALVTKESLPNPHKLGLKCLLNNYPMQDSCTEQLVFKTEACIEWISQFVTLEPGDVILTGTPPGVGVFKDPPVYLKPGDEVTCEIEGIGSITNPVIAEDV